MVVSPILPLTENLDVAPEVKERMRAEWAAWWLPLREQVRGELPSEDSLEERRALHRFVTGISNTMSEFGPLILPHLRRGFDRLLRDLVAAEDEKAKTDRRLGLRFLSRAVQVLDTFFEAFRAFAPGLLANGLPKVAESEEEFARTLDPASIALLRLELAVFVAFDLVNEGTPGEFVEWASRAQNASNHASPYVAVFFRAKNHVGDADADHLSADLVLSSTGFDRLVELGENPPAPSTRLRRLVRGRDS